jgi:hypothetical protein
MSLPQRGIVLVPDSSLARPVSPTGQSKETRRLQPEEVNPYESTTNWGLRCGAPREHHL